MQRPYPIVATLGVIVRCGFKTSDWDIAQGQADKNRHANIFKRPATEQLSCFGWGFRLVSK